MSIADAFPHYDTDTLPPIPVVWTDVSWRNDTCPSWLAPNGLQVFIDYADAQADMREFSEPHPRFVVQATEEGTGAVLDLLSSDDWNEVLNLVLAHPGPAEITVLAALKAVAAEIAATYDDNPVTLSNRTAALVVAALKKSEQPL